MLHTHHIAFESFWVSGVLIFAALVYLRGWLRIRRLNLESVAGWRAGIFLLGLLFIWISTASPLAALDHDMLTAHMVQHLLLMTLAPPLILLGMPRKPLAHGLLQRFLQAISHPLRGPMQKMGRALTHLALCWLEAPGASAVRHFPSAVMLALRSPAWH